MAKNSEAKIRNNNVYAKKTYLRFMMNVRKDDKDVIKKLESVPSKNGYIIDLIRKDIKTSKH